MKVLSAPAGLMHPLGYMRSPRLGQGPCLATEPTRVSTHTSAAVLGGMPTDIQEDMQGTTHNAHPHPLSAPVRSGHQPRVGAGVCPAGAPLSFIVAWLCVRGGEGEEGGGGRRKEEERRGKERKKEGKGGGRGERRRPPCTFLRLVWPSGGCWTWGRYQWIALEERNPMVQEPAPKNACRPQKSTFCPRHPILVTPLTRGPGGMLPWRGAATPRFINAPTPFLPRRGRGMRGGVGEARQRVQEGERNEGWVA